MSEAANVTPVEKRSERRVTVHLPVRVEGIDRRGMKFEERTTSENVCRGGVAFSLTHDLELNVELQLSIPLPRKGRAAESDFLSHGRVRHIAGNIVGVQFTGPRFNHIFV